MNRSTPRTAEQLTLVGDQFFLGSKPVNFEECPRDIRDAYHQYVRHTVRHNKRENERQEARVKALLAAAQSPPIGSSSSSRLDK